MTSKSWTASRIATLKKRAGTYTTRYVFSPMISIVSAVWLVLVICVVVLWCALDFIPKRRSKPLTSPAPQPPKHPYYNRPHFIQEGSTVSIEMPDGQIIALEPLSASLMVKEGVECLAAAYVYEKTRIKTDAD
jgi:hypothetical protein